MRPPTVVVSTSKSSVFLDLIPTEWEDHAQAAQLVNYLIIKDKEFRVKVVNSQLSPRNTEYIAALAMERFLPLLASEELWFDYHTEKFHVRQETIDSLICLCELAKQP